MKEILGVPMISFLCTYFSQNQLSLVFLYSYFSEEYSIAIISYKSTSFYSSKRLRLMQSGYFKVVLELQLMIGS